jgi:RNase H-like domain found in reverse transcriptase/Reverse transcriptase (RNA-dependent DNA polymerase)
MYFGLTNSPTTFQKTMDRVFQSLKNKYPGMLFVYMDDILITTINNPALHEQIIHEVLDLLEKESFFLKLSKCKFKCTSIKYLGIVVEKGTLKIDPTKCKGLASWPQKLSMVWQVCSTLGVLGYQRPFIPGFAKIAKPLTDLLKKEHSFMWTDECTQAVDKLITIVTSNPILYCPNYDKPFILKVDASQYAIGAILQQVDNSGKLHPVGYFSKALTDAERGYDVHDRELLALVKGLDHWWHLLASGHQTTVYTDHKNLLYYRKP